MRRIVGIIIFVLGLLLVIVGIIKLVQGVFGTGVFAIIIGLAIFGLSFIPQTDAGADAPPPLSPADRITGVFYEPDRIFKNLRFHPRWFAAFLVMVAFGLTYQLAFTRRVTPERIAGETADKVIESGWIPPDKAADFRAQRVEEAKSPVARITGTLIYIGGAFTVMLILASLYLLCVLAFGGRINFWQSLSVAVYGSLPPAIIGSVLGLIILFVKAPEDINVFKGQRGLARADLGLLFDPAAHPLLYVFGSAIGILSLYGWWITVSGLRNTSTKLSNASAWTIAFLLWLLGLILLLILAAVFPSFVG